MQMETSMRYHLTPVRMAITEKSTNNKCWRGCGEKETPIHYWWECKSVQSLGKTVQKLLKKLKIELPHDPETHSLDLYPDETILQKDTCTLCSSQNYLQWLRHRNNLHIHQQMNGSEEVVYTHTHTHTQEYYSAIKKKEIMSFAEQRWTQISLH